MEFLNNKNTRFKYILILVYTGSFIGFSFFTRLSRSDRIFIPLLMIPLLLYLLIWLYLTNYERYLDRRILWGVALLLRLITLVFPIALSDDIYRYIWDGRVQHAGYNPYQYTPDSLNLISLRDRGWTLINHKDISTPYPPGSQIVFFLLTSMATDLELTIMIFRIIMILFDFGVIYLIEQLLELYNKSNNLVTIYAWSPLVILEIAGNAHNEIMALFFMLLAIYLALRNGKKRRYEILISSISITFAVLIKIFPIVALPFLLKYWRVQEYLSSFIVTTISIMPYYQPDINPVYPEGQQVFVMYFRFNESIYRLYDAIISKVTSSMQFGRYVYIIAMVIFVLYVLFRYFSSDNNKDILLHYIVFLLFVGLLLGPDVQPWYVLWMFPLAVIIEDKAIITFSMSVLLSYVIYPDYDQYGIWRENTWILIIEYLPVYILFVMQLLGGFYNLTLSNNNVES